MEAILEYCKRFTKRVSKRPTGIEDLPIYEHWVKKSEFVHKAEKNMSHINFRFLEWLPYWSIVNVLRNVLARGPRALKIYLYMDAVSNSGFIHKTGK